MPPSAVLKIGGSLARRDGLRELCREIGRLGSKHPLLVVPGGGEFADLVREAYRKYTLGESAAHRMALLAMDQFGHLLNHLIEESSPVTEPDSAERIYARGRVALLLPSVSVLRDSRLPHSWQVTSDSIAAWVAHKIGCRKLILLKDIDGLMPPSATGTHPEACIREMTVAGLKKHTGGVDAYLGGFLVAKNLETWIVNGLNPERIRELMDSAATTGTRIAPDFG